MTTRSTPSTFGGRSDGLPTREIWPAIVRGAKAKCPACGIGSMFEGYLTVRDECPHCGEELHHHRADDAPTRHTADDADAPDADDDASDAPKRQRTPPGHAPSACTPTTVAPLIGPLHGRTPSARTDASRRRTPLDVYSRALLLTSTRASPAAARVALLTSAPEYAHAARRTAPPTRQVSTPSTSDAAEKPPPRTVSGTRGCAGRRGARARWRDGSLKPLQHSATLQRSSALRPAICIGSCALQPAIATPGLRF